MNPRFLKGSDLRQGDSFVRAYDGVPGKYPSLAVIRITSVLETGNGGVSITGVRMLADGSEGPDKRHLVPADLVVLLLDRAPKPPPKKTHRIKLANGKYVGARSPDTDDYSEVGLQDAVEFDLTHGTHVARVLQGKLEPL